MAEQWITSIGIDLGTSTTKFIVSSLGLKRTLGLGALPRYDISERKLVYESPIYTTPVLSEDEIDIHQVSCILAAEYKKAQISMEGIQSGAVMITGETANKKNARRILHWLAEHAGRFVVATAGADLEAILAGKGSGAERRSQETSRIIANLDIGGGTANTAFFHQGRVVGTANFHVGGRLIRLTQQGEIRYISPFLQTWLKMHDIPLQEENMVTYDMLYQIAVKLSQDLLDFLTGVPGSMAVQQLLLGKKPQVLPRPYEVMISGGVGRMMEDHPPGTLEEVAVYGDFGPLLAHALKRMCDDYSFQVIQADQTVRATVIGAGMQSTEISGSTVFIHPHALPLKNVPVVKIQLDDENLTERAIRIHLAEASEHAARLYGTDGSVRLAWAITGISHCSYLSLRALTDVLVNTYLEKFPNNQLLIVLCENDMAKALGQSLFLNSKRNLKIVCIDQIRVEHGDYIDIGEPVSGTIVPVIIKTLAFPASDNRGRIP